MSEMAGINPWVSMWAQPRSTVRALILKSPSYGLFRLAIIFSLQSIFFYANWWSFGVKFQYPAILLVGLVLAPLVGLLWIYLVGVIFYLTGRILKGNATQNQLRTAVVWSKIPSLATLLIWLIFIFSSPNEAFIQNGVSSSVWLTFFILILGTWSLLLLVQGIREIQGFSLTRSVFNVFLAFLLFSTFCLLAIGAGRYIQYLL
jgi:hypothetical protein